MDGSHMVISIKLIDSQPVLSPFGLVDCGATGYSFVDKEFARDHNLPLHKLKDPRVLEVIDGRPIESGNITHYVKCKIDINGHKETIAMFVTNSVITLLFLVSHGYGVTTSPSIGPATPLPSTRITVYVTVPTMV